MKHPDKLQRLMDEIDQADREGRLSEYVSWKEAQQMPYLDAVVKEAGRLHPPFGLHLERLVPPQGAVISGTYLPGGTVVGINSWAIHRREDPFGKDADEFRPERWLCPEMERRGMERALLTVSSVFLLVCQPWSYLTECFSSSARVVESALASISRSSRCTSLYPRFYGDTRLVCGYSPPEKRSKLS
jgi:hypothetical protein